MDEVERNDGQQRLAAEMLEQIIGCRFMENQHATLIYKGRNYPIETLMLGSSAGNPLALAGG